MAAFIRLCSHLMFSISGNQMCFPSAEWLPVALKDILGGYILSSVFRGQTLGSRMFTHNHEANKQCQVCKH